MKETKYKQTEIGIIPEDWEVVKLGDIINYKKGKKPKKLYKDVKENYLPYLTAEYFRTGYIKHYVDINKENNVETVEKDDIVLIWDGSNAGDVFTGLKGILASTMIKILPTILSLDKGYLFYYLKTKFSLLNSKTTGSTIPHVNKNLFNNLPILLPSLPEQKKIAHVLSVIQEAKEKTEAVIKAAKELKKSLMKYLFTYGPVPLDEAENVKLKETEIGLIPEEWEVAKLGDVVERTLQKDPKKEPDWKFKYIDVSSIDRETLRIIDYKVYLGKNAPSRAKKIVKMGDIIFATVRPTLRRLAMVEEKFDGHLCSTAFCVLRAKECLAHNRYLFYVLQRDEFISELGKIQRGANYPAVTDKDVKNLLIPLPPLPEQKKIASILSAVDEKIEKEENKKKALEELFKSMLHNLMTGKVRVKDLDIKVDENVGK